MYDAEQRVHNSRSQRLDASGIAGLYGLSLRELCRATSKEYETVRKTPDSPALQELLAQLYRIWDIAFEVLNEDEPAVKRWLHRPNRGLDRARPIDLLGPERIDELEEAVKRLRSADYA
jgi:uncharacterized protein (DUF2384 family)